MYTFTVTKMRTRTYTDEPLATSDPLVVSSPTSANTYVVYSNTDTTPTLSFNLSHAVASKCNYTTTSIFEPYLVVLSSAGYEEENVGSKDAVYKALELSFIGYVGWLIVVS